MTSAEAGVLLATLKAAFPRQPMGKATARVYLRFLGDLDYEPARVAVADLIGGLRFFPSIAELRQAVWRRSEGAIEPEEAWALVQSALRRTEIAEVLPGGHYRYADPDLPPAVMDAARVIGWQRLCVTDNLVADRAHFMRIFEVVARRRYEGWSAGHAPWLPPGEETPRIAEGAGSGERA